LCPESARHTYNLSESSVISVGKKVALMSCNQAKQNHL